MRPTPILYLITELDPGGAERVLFNIVSNLDRLRYQPVVVSLKDLGFFGSRLQRIGIPVERLDIIRYYDLWRAKRFISILRDYKPRLIHSFLIHANLLARIACILKPRPKIVCSVHTMIDAPFPLLFDRLTRHVPDLILCASESVRQFVHRRIGLSLSKLHLLYNGVPIPSQQHPVPEVTTVLFASRLVPGKGAEDLLKAATIVLRRSPDVRFVFAGEGPLRDKLIRMTKSYAVQDNIEFTGFCEEITPLLKQTRCLVHPSRLGEAVPMAILEAMAASRAVIAADSGGCAEAVIDGETGFLVPPGNINALADRIGLLVSDQRLSLRLGQAAYHRARRLFSLETMIKNLEGVYQSLIPLA